MSSTVWIPRNVGERSTDHLHMAGGEWSPFLAFDSPEAASKAVQGLEGSWEIRECGLDDLAIESASVGFTSTIGRAVELGWIRVAGWEVRPNPDASCLHAHVSVPPPA